MKNFIFAASLLFAIPTFAGDRQFCGDIGPVRVETTGTRCPAALHIVRIALESLPAPLQDTWIVRVGGQPTGLEVNQRTVRGQSLPELELGLLKAFYVEGNY
jgi:hypothetical protein